MTQNIVELESGRRMSIEVWKAGSDGEMPPIQPQLHERVAKMFKRWQDATPFKDDQCDKPDETFAEALARLYVEVCHEIMRESSDAIHGALWLTGAVSGIELTPQQIARTKAAARARIARQVEAAAARRKSKRRAKP